MNEENPDNPSRRRLLKGAAWTLPVITSVTATPIAAAVSQSTDHPELCFTAQIRTTTNTTSESVGDLRIEAVCDGIPETDSITVIIDPATRPGRLFHMHRGGSQNFLVNTTGNALSSTVKVLTFNREVRAGDMGFLNWNFSGYAGLQGRVTITVLHGDDLLTVWRNPKGSW